MLEGVLADDIRVEDEERGVVLAQDLLGELQRTGGTEGLRLDRELYPDVVFFLVLGRSDCAKAGERHVWRRMARTFFRAAVMISGL